MFYTIPFSDSPGKEKKFIYAIFGVQHPSSPAHPLALRQTSYITTLTTLLSSSAAHFTLSTSTSTTFPSSSHHKTTTIITAYWSSATSHHQNYTLNPAVQDFWSSLPDDAGVFFETITVSSEYFQFGTNSPEPTGVAQLFGLVASDKAGFWGSYRARIPASETDDLATRLVGTKEGGKYELPRYEALKSRRSCGQEGEAKGEAKEAIVRGKVEVTNYPENICFVRESQTRRGVGALEKQIWRDTMLGYVESWVGFLESLVGARDDGGGGDGSGSGVLDLRITTSSETQTEDPENNPHMAIETNQYGYFIDLSYLERAARSHRGHLRLRDEMNRTYCPTGALADGKSAFWVEMCILKKGDFRGLYVGCAEGTGLLGFRDWVED